MPSLIGNKPNQVPSNGDLGTLAFQDSNAVNISGGTVDVSAGTAALPTLGTTGDPNTGVFFPAADTVAVATNGAERMRIDSSGNVGVGVTPNPWLSSFKAIEINGLGANIVSNGSNRLDMGTNSYLNSSSQWIYTNTAAASRYIQVSGVHQWHTAASGTSGTAMTLNEVMRISNSGGVSIGNTTDRGAASLNVSGLIYPQQAATAPTYVKGAIYFDTTLNKLRVGGATAWETITSV